MRRILAALLLLAALAAAPPADRGARVVSSDPIDGARDLPCRGLVVHLTFSCDMDPATLTRETVEPAYTDRDLRFFRDPFLDTSYTWDKPTRTLAVALPSLLPEKEIVLLVTEGAHTERGRSLEGEGPVRRRLSFTTGRCP